MTDQWPYWVVVEEPPEGKEGPGFPKWWSIADSENECCKRYRHRTGYSPDLSNKINTMNLKVRRCKLELEPIEVKP